jgi:hypothetical protein
VPAEIDLDAGSEPAEMIIAVFRDIKCGFRKVVLGGDRLERRVGKPVIQRANSGGIASKEFAREGVHLVDGNVHSLVSREGRGDGKFRYHWFL